MSMGIFSVALDEWSKVASASPDGNLEEDHEPHRLDEEDLNPQVTDEVTLRINGLRKDIMSSREIRARYRRLLPDPGRR